MSENTSQGQEFPDRPTKRLLTDGGQITACPECDSPSIKPRNPGKPSSPPSHTTNWYCNNCGAQFDEAVERAREHRPGRRGLAGKLARAEPDDLVTDGGREVVYVRSQARGSSVEVYHTDRECSTLQQATQIIERERRHVPADATECKHCQGAIGGADERHDPDWEPQRLLREAEPGDLVTDGGRSVADVLAECETRTRIEPLEAVLRGDRDRESLGAADWYRPVALTNGTVCLAFETGVQTIHIGHDGDAFRFTSEIYRRGHGGSRPVDDVAEVRALLTKYEVKPVHRAETPFSDDARDAPLVTDGGRSRPTHHGVCRGCPDEWVGDAQGVHRDAEIHSLAHGHRTEVAEVDPR